MTWKEYQKSEHNFEVQTTFWEDFSIADRFGVSAIKDTYKRALEYAKTNYKYLTELSLVLNHRLWMRYNQGNERYAKVYDEIWRKCHNCAHRHLKGKELSFYLNVTD